jgi:hypothetical protein
MFRALLAHPFVKSYFRILYIVCPVSVIGPQAVNSAHKLTRLNLTE